MSLKNEFMENNVYDYARFEIYEVFGILLVKYFFIVLVFKSGNKWGRLWRSG